MTPKPTKEAKIRKPKKTKAPASEVVMVTPPEAISAPFDPDATITLIVEGEPVPSEDITFELDYDESDDSVSAGVSEPESEPEPEPKPEPAGFVPGDQVRLLVDFRSTKGVVFRAGQVGVIDGHSEGKVKVWAHRNERFWCAPEILEYR